MKKGLLLLMVAALTLALAMPAQAGVTLTSKGRMDVTGIWLKNNVLDWGPGAPGNDQSSDSSNAWYQMELVVDPVLHINDKVRIHSRITFLERVWTGADGVANVGVDFRGEKLGGNDIWMERLYLSFPLFGGTMYAGRMSGGMWAYDFQNSNDNRDRVKYVRKFGPVVVAALVEKLFEGDSGVLATPLTLTPAVGDGWDVSEADNNSYAVGAVIPFSKQVVYKPLLYYIDFQDGLTGPGEHAHDVLFMNGLGLHFGNFYLDTEANIRYRSANEHFFNPADADWENWDESQLSWWLDAGMKFDRFSFGGGWFWLEGCDEDTNPWDNNSLWGVGGDFEPLFLLFSEDVGLLWGTAGVPNGSVGARASGYLGFMGHGSFNITEKMSIGGVVGHVQADEMVWDGVDDEIGWEFDINFAWNFMDNLTYQVDLGYFWTGDYFDDDTPAVASDVDANNSYGMRHMLVINW